MCVSPQADLFATVVVGGVGVDTIRRVGDRRMLWLAGLPLVFAAHQFTETFVWWGLQGRVSAVVGDTATWLYLFVALALLPVLVPVAIAATEPSSRRRHLMFGCVAAGFGVAVVMLDALVRGPVVAALGDHHVFYQVNIPFGYQLTGVYVLATCGPALLSSYRHLVLFGVVNVGAELVLAWVSVSGFISLWCGWAAVTSLAINLHLRSAGAVSPPPTALTAG